jgi:hypothetical protein
MTRMWQGRRGQPRGFYGNRLEGDFLLRDRLMTAEAIAAVSKCSKSNSTEGGDCLVEGFFGIGYEFLSAMETVLSPIMDLGIETRNCPATLGCTQGQGGPCQEDVSVLYRELRL